MMVSGEKAALYRSAMVKILQKYYAGDDSLNDEIEANAKSNSPIAQMARASLAAETAQNEISLPYKRKIEELEIARLELENDAKRTANRLSEHAIRDAEREHIVKCTTSYGEVCQDTVMDERARLIFKDCFLNMAMQQGQSGKLLTNGEPNKPISISQVAKDLGLKIPSSEFISIGMRIRKKYVEKHGKEPTKHEQLCEGRMTRVNSYTESDRDIVEEVLRAHAK